MKVLPSSVSERQLEANLAQCVVIKVYDKVYEGKHYISNAQSFSVMRHIFLLFV